MSRKNQKNKRLEAWRLIILILLMFSIVFLMSIPFISAIELNPFGNSKVIQKQISQNMPDFLKADFNSKYGLIELHSNIMWINTGTIAEYSLTDNTDFCSINCHATGKAILYQDGKLFEETNFYDIKNNMNKEELSYKVYIGVGYETKQRMDCSEIINGEKICQDKSYLEPIWEKYNEETLKAGNYEWKITGIKQPTESIEWIVTSFGKKLSEWAAWDVSKATYLEYGNLTGQMSNPQDIYFKSDGTEMYIADYTAGKILGYGLSTAWNSTTISNNQMINISARVLHPFGLFINSSGTGMFVSSGTKVFKYDLTTAWNVTTAVYSQNATLSEDSTINGLSFKNDGTKMFTIGSQNDRFYEYDLDAWNLATLIYREYKNILLQDGYNEGVYLREDGLKIYQIGDQYNKVYEYDITNAYNVTNATYKQFLDISSETNAGTGVYFKSDGSKMYVADAQHGWVREYNLTSGVAPTSIEITTTLISPNDSYNITSSNIYFSANYTVSYGNLTNTSLYIWTSAEILYGINYTDIKGIFNSTNLSFYLPVGNYKWNYITYAQNSSSNISSSATTNRTINIYEFSVDKESYNNQTTEGNTEIFYINITTGGTIATIGNLIYNGTSYFGTITNIGGYSYALSKTIDIPSVTSTQNLTFYWNITLNDGYTQSTDLRNQSVSNINFDNCSAYSQTIVNFTLKDEETQVNVPISDIINSTIDIDLKIYPIYSNTPITNFSLHYLNITNAAVCITPEILNSSTYRMFLIVRYLYTGHEIEYYNIQNFTLTNSSIPQNINLFDLETSKSQPFVITFKDSSFTLIPNVLIDITRYYPAEGVSKTVEIPKTDSNGQTVSHLVEKNVIYTFIVRKYGTILATFSNVIAVCQDTSTGQCVINLNAFSSGTNPTDFTKTYNLEYTPLTLDKTTNTVSTIFSTQDGSVSTVSLNTTKFDALGNVTVCSQQFTTSSGTLSCPIPAGYGNVTVISKLYKDGQLISTSYFTIKQSSFDTFGYIGIFLLIIMYLTIPFMFIPTKVGMILAAMIGFVMAIMLNLVEGSLIGAGASFLWFIIAGFIIIWRIAKVD